MRTISYFLCLFSCIIFFSGSAFAQTANFDETWKEFLENNKISNMSELIRPDKVFNQPDYAKYLLMNVNSSFCQSEVKKAENLMTELQELDERVYTPIPGFGVKMQDLKAKMQAFYSIDVIWKRFLQTKEVMPEEWEAITAVQSICEKQTLAKYSYMMAYYQLCQGDVSESMNIFQNRTLRLTEKTSLRIADVEGLATEVANMKALYRDMANLESAWKTYMRTGTSPGFDIELPLYLCHPIPNMKALVLQGAVDVCRLAPAKLDEVKRLQAESGVVPKGELAQKIQELGAAVAENEGTLAVLNEAWEAFIPNNKVMHIGQYGHDYCTVEPLIRAYIMDGFAYLCGMGEEMLERIYELQSSGNVQLEDITMVKINDLAQLIEQYKADGVELGQIWKQFVAQGDQLVTNYQPAEFYCDNVHRVMDWTMRGLSGSCEEGHLFLEKIDEFQGTFEFKFFEELECRVQKLRIKVWDCRQQALAKLARLEAPDAVDQRLEELMREYGMAERPELCGLEE